MVDTRTAAQGGRMRPQTFGDAFREARLAGDKTFEFNGKTYTTKTAEEQSREIAARAAPGSGRGPSAGRTAADRDTTSGRAEIPTSGAARGPAPTGEGGMSDTTRNVLNTLGALGAGAGAGLGARALVRHQAAKRSAEALRRLDEPGVEAAQRAAAERRAMSTLKEGLAKDLAQDIGSGSVGRSTPMRSTATTTDTGRRFTPAQEMEAATSTMRGAVGRRQVQEARTARERSQAAAQAKAEKPAVQGDKARMTPRSRTRDEEDVEFKRGGKVKAYKSGGSVRGAGIAQRGVRKCKVY